MWIIAKLDDEGDKIKAALKACFSPFIPLTKEVDGDKLAQQLYLWVITERKNQPSLAEELYSLVWSVDVRKPCVVALSTKQACLKVPNLDTKIIIKRFKEDSLMVIIDFREAGGSNTLSEQVSKTLGSYGLGIEFEQEHVAIRMPRDD